MSLLKNLFCTALAVTFSVASPLITRSPSADLSSCDGYTASNVQDSQNGFTADLTLAGEGCNVYGTDLNDLTLTVEYQSPTRLHVIIQDADQQVYQVPGEVFTRPGVDDSGSIENSELEFHHRIDPFSFWVVRKGSGEVLFDTRAAPMVFEDQYVRLRTGLPDDPSLYGLGEHTDPFMLNTTNYTRTVWNRDAYGTPVGTNLYGDHPIYFDHRGSSGTHGVFLLNSNGMEVKINDTDGQYLEYNILGGVLDFYFLAGPSPVEVAQQYSEVVGKSAMMPYWGFGYHQCRYGMQDIYEVAGVIHNYSATNIPLETMWTDIDYMYLRRVFTLDPERFPLELVREVVQYLHDHQQHYIVMVDPAMAYQTEDYAPFTEGASVDAFLKVANGSIYLGVVWPGVTEFPDWFHPNTQDYWDGQFLSFFDADTGVDIDALWIDMNEASNFCNYPCRDPFKQAIEMGNPPYPPPIRLGSPIPLPGFSEAFQPQCGAEVTFNVEASSTSDEYLRVIGSSLTLGEGNIWNSVEMTADGNSMWTATVVMPPNARFSYQYARVESDGSFVYEQNNRTLMAGACGDSKSTDDTITTDSPSDSNSGLSKRSLPVSARQPLEKRQSSEGSMLGLPGRNLIDPPYMINNAQGSLSNKTIDTNIEHYGGWKEYDTHNLYGAMMSEASRKAMLARRPGLRPMVITRSTFAGSGRQVGKWLGDNLAEWDHYLFSVAGLLEFGALFQMPMVGSDVCGFGGVTNDKLCARWATMGAFSPFYRNHGELNSPPHEFYRWPVVAQAARNAIDTRYKLLDYIYTAMYEQNQTGTPLVQPMFFAYPEDPKCAPLQYQYLYGPGMMVAPATVENSTMTQVYMPDDVFYDFYTHETLRGSGQFIDKHVPYTSIPLYYKGGSIVAQRANSTYTTAELREQNFAVVIAPGLDGEASGSLYLDDGVSIEQPATSYIQFKYKNGQFKMTGTFGYDAGVSIESVIVLGKSSDSDAEKMSMQQMIPLTGPYSTSV